MIRKAHLLFLAIASYSTTVGADPVITDGQWRGSIIAGVSAASGNTKSTNANIGADATRTTEVNKLSLYLTGLYGTKEETNGVTTETANLARAGAKYDHNLSEQVFSFVSLDAELDKLQMLDLRTVFGFGAGYYLIKTEEKTFDAFSGATYNRERFVNLARDSAELVLGEESSHKISANTSVKQRVAIYPNLKETGEYRGQLDASLVTAINSRVGLQLTLSDRYQSNPVPGVKKNDLLFLTSVTYKFGPK